MNRKERKELRKSLISLIDLEEEIKVAISEATDENERLKLSIDLEKVSKAKNDVATTINENKRGWGQIIANAVAILGAAAISSFGINRTVKWQTKYISHHEDTAGMLNSDAWKNRVKIPLR